MVRRSPGRVRDLPTAVDRAGKLPTGIEGQNVPEDFSIPPVGIEDVDRSMFELFDKRLNLQVSNKTSTSKVHALFAGGERFAMVKRNLPFRDKNGALILPLVSIRRTGIEHSIQGVVPGRGMGVNTGDLTIRRRLSTQDPLYQNLVNKLQLQNQSNVGVGSTTRRFQPRSRNTVTGEFLAPDLGKNIFEVITMPFPHFFTALYEVTFWTQHIQHMNQVVERFMTSFDGQGNNFRLDTPKGYWFVGYVDDDFNSDDNFTDYSGEERYVKLTFTMKVPAYMHAPQNPGDPIPFRRFLSAPQVSFGIYLGGVPEGRGGRRPAGSGDLGKFTLSQVDLLDKRGDRITDPKSDLGTVNDLIRDPFTGAGISRHLRIVTRNPRKGETLISKRVLDHVEDVNF